MTFWRPFCLCKLGGQELKISLGNRIFWIQHTQIRLKSLVPNFCSKMLLTFTFFRNLTSLLSIRSSRRTFVLMLVTGWLLSSQSSTPLGLFQRSGERPRSSPSWETWETWWWSCKLPASLPSLYFLQAVWTDTPDQAYSLSRTRRSKHVLDPKGAAMIKYLPLLPTMRPATNVVSRQGLLWLTSLRHMIPVHCVDVASF